MADNAERRLAALLRDEEYGPKLARLNRADERIVLDLIDQNKGREARKELNRLDDARRTQRTTSENAKQFAKMSKDDRKANWKKMKKKRKDKTDEAAFWRLYKAAMAQ
jgi:hypothetical protein